jgi:hypothetical protein
MDIAHSHNTEATPHSGEGDRALEIAAQLRRFSESLLADCQRYRDDNRRLLVRSAQARERLDEIRRRRLNGWVPQKAP